MWCTHIEAIKEVLAWAMNKHFQFTNNNNVTLKSCTTKLPMNKAVLSFRIIFYTLLRGP